MQEDIEQRTIAISVRVGRLTGDVLKRAIAATLRKMADRKKSPHVGATSMKALVGEDGSAENIEVSGRIRSFERIARKHGVRYKVFKQKDADPPRWTVYFKGAQAGALDTAFREYTRNEKLRESRPSVLANISRLKERIAKIARDAVKNKERGGPEL
jgi:hypothetical protein